MTDLKLFEAYVDEEIEHFIISQKYQLAKNYELIHSHTIEIGDALEETDISDALPNAMSLYESLINALEEDVCFYLRNAIDDCCESLSEIYDEFILNEMNQVWCREDEIRRQEVTKIHKD